MFNDDNGNGGKVLVPTHDIHICIDQGEYITVIIDSNFSNLSLSLPPIQWDGQERSPPVNIISQPSRDQIGE